MKRIALTLAFVCLLGGRAWATTVGCNGNSQSVTTSSTAVLALNAGCDLVLLCNQSLGEGRAVDELLDGLAEDARGVGVVSLPAVIANSNACSSVPHQGSGAPSARPGQPDAARDSLIA